MAEPKKKDYVSEALSAYETYKSFEQQTRDNIPDLKQVPKHLQEARDILVRLKQGTTPLLHKDVERLWNILCGN